MTTLKRLLAVLLTFSCWIALSAQQPAALPLPIGRDVDMWVTGTEKLVTPAADAMPEDRYGFTPAGAGFAGVRTYGDQVKHLAAANYQLAALVLGEQPPAGTANETAPADVRTKADIMTYLHGSFAALHRAASAIGASNLEDPVAVGKRVDSRVGLIFDALAHSHDHYGQMVEYLRMNLIVPPASR